MPESLADIPLHPLTYEEAVGVVSSMIRNRQRPAAFIVQANAYTVVSAHENQTYMEVLRAADLSLPDGMPLVWMLRLKGNPIKTRVYGPDMMLRLCDEASRYGWRCFLYGGESSTLELLRDILLQRFPSLQIVGTHSPPFRPLSPEEDATVCEMINAARPDLLWVGLGGPRQDRWMYDHRDRLNVSVMHGVGAAFDFLSGRVPQAPRWMMDAGLEWLFRLAVEPRRLWRRYTITNLKFLYYLFSREVLGRSKRDQKPGA